MSTSAQWIWGDVPNADHFFIGTMFTTSASAPVPEPATMLLFGLGLLSLAGISRKKK